MIICRGEHFSGERHTAGGSGAGGGQQWRPRNGRRLPPSRLPGDVVLFTTTALGNHDPVAC